MVCEIIISKFDKNIVYVNKFLFIYRFEQDQFDKVPLFIFGDFNFRLDSNQLVNVSIILNIK